MLRTSVTYALTFNHILKHRRLRHWVQNITSEVISAKILRPPHPSELWLMAQIVVQFRFWDRSYSRSDTVSNCSTIPVVFKTGLWIDPDH